MLAVIGDAGFITPMNLSAFLLGKFLDSWIFLFMSLPMV
jgi:hypothetical protein